MCCYFNYFFYFWVGDVKYCYVVKVRDFFNWQIIIVVGCVDQCFWCLWIVGIFNQIGDLELGDRCYGVRVKDFGVEVREFYCFLVGY